MRSSVILIVNMNSSHYDRDFVLTGMPYDGIWQVSFDGDRAEYSNLYGDDCTGQEIVNISAGRGVLCIARMSMLVLTKATTLSVNGSISPAGGVPVVCKASRNVLLWLVCGVLVLVLVGSVCFVICSRFFKRRL